MANVIIESQFITAILENKKSIDDVVKSDFEPRFLQLYADVYEWILNYHQQNGQLPSMELAQTRFPKFVKADLVDNVDEIITALREYNKEDRFRTDIQQSLTMWEKTGDIDRSIRFLQNKLDKYIIENRQDVFDLTDENFKTGYELYQKRRAAYLANSRYGIPSGLGAEFDINLNGGWQNSLYYGAVGKSNVGKTWTLMVAAKAALAAGKTVLFFSLEGQIDRDYNRLLTVSTELDNASTLAGVLDEMVYLTAQKQLLDLSVASGGKFYLALFGDREYYTTNVMYQKIRKYKPDIVFVDYLTLMSDGSGQEDWNSYINISKRLKTIATSEEIPIVAGVQGRLDSFGKKPGSDLDSDDIASSKGIMRDFDAMFGISRPPGKQNILKINTMKNRDGEFGFRGFYQTNWNNGKIQFVGYANDDDF